MIPLILIVGALAVVAVYFAFQGTGPEGEGTPFVNPFKALSLSEYTPCGIDGIDRLPLADLVSEEFGFDATVAIARAMVAICNNETHGNTAAPVVGDTGSSLGPSIGPLQVLRATAIDLGLVPKSETQAEYRQRAMNEMWCLRAGVKAFAAKLIAAGGDLADAIQRYNGSGSRAEEYRANALSFLAEKFGDNWEEG